MSTEPIRAAKQLLLGKDILLESGTNELEVLVFYLDGSPYGVNVAKVREVLPPMAVHKMPSSHVSVEGAFQLRDRVVPLICLREYLGMTAYAPGTLSDPEKSRIIVTEFNQVINAFRVDGVEQIHRVNWSNVHPLPDVDGLYQTPITAITHINNNMVPLLDFEQIIDRIHNFGALRPGVVDPASMVDRESKVVAFAEDSRTVRELVKQTLEASGYKQLKVFGNGEELWHWLHQIIAENPSGDLAGKVDLVLTDIEMPRIDGLHLCKLIREHQLLRALPVVVFSSLITPDNVKKCEAVGATAQISKPQLFRAVELLDRVLAPTEPAAGTLAHAMA